MYKTSFNGLVISTKGVYSVYNLNQEELESLKLNFAPDINGSNGNYTVFRNAQRRVYLNLFVHDIWKPIVFDIRNDLLKLYKSNKLYSRDIEALSKQLKEMRLTIHVDYVNGQWHIIDYPKFLELLAQLISDNKKEAG